MKIVFLKIYFLYYFLYFFKDGCPEKTENGVMNNWNLEIVFRIPAYGFVLPNLSELPAEFRDFLEKDLIETSTLKRLESSGNFILIILIIIIIIFNFN